MNHITLFLQQKRATRGFTLVETIVSAFIITFAVLGPLTVASNASTHAKTTKDVLTATYLAQEALELLRLQQDTVYIQCGQSSALCVPTGTETLDQTAWRIFRERVGANAQGVSCYAADSPAGCSYDFIDMSTNLNNAPSKYLSTAASCGTFSMETLTGLYVCTGARGTGAGFTQTSFSRSVSITPVPTITGSEQFYYEDLRVTVTITFRRANGYTRQIKIVDFIHARA